MLSYELREQVIRYIDQEISPTELEDWFVPRLSAFLQFPDSDDAEMIAAVEMALAELADGLIDEAEGRAMVRETVDRLGNTVAAPAATEGYTRTVVTGSRSRSIVSGVSGARPIVSFASRS